MTNSKWSVLLVLLSLWIISSCKENDKTVTTVPEQAYVVYLVRHAEKDTQSATNDPNLTACGVLRAKNLAELLKNAGIAMVYSTNYKRTQQTAKATASIQNLEIIDYDPRNLDQMAALVLETKRNALIVGHSNTTPILAGILTAKKLEPIEEHVYNHLYKISITATEKRLELINTGFDCVY